MKILCYGFHEVIENSLKVLNLKYKDENCIIKYLKCTEFWGNQISSHCKLEFLSNVDKELEFNYEDTPFKAELKRFQSIIEDDDLEYMKVNNIFPDDFFSGYRLYEEKKVIGEFGTFFVGETWYHTALIHFDR